MIFLKNLENFNQKVFKAGFTKRGFARHCGISESTLIQISNGKQSPRPDTAKKICIGLDVVFDEIFFINSAVNEDKEVI